MPIPCPLCGQPVEPPCICTCGTGLPYDTGAVLALYYHLHARETRATGVRARGLVQRPPQARAELYTLANANGESAMSVTERDIVADLRRHGFTQLRALKHGILWGHTSSALRITTPHNYNTARGGYSTADHTWAAWLKVRSKLYEELPGLKAHVTRAADPAPASEPAPEPVRNPDEALASASASAPVTEPAPPAAPSSAPLAASDPASAPAPRGQEPSPMSTRRRKCPKCAQLFARLDRHVAVCAGSPEANAARVRQLARDGDRARAAGHYVGKGHRRAAPAPALAPSRNGAEPDAALVALSDFSRAASTLVDTMRGVVQERNAMRARLARFTAALREG